MTDLDTRLIPVVYDLIDKFGISATFYVELDEPDDYDPTTGHTTEDSDSGVAWDVTPPEDYADIFIDGDLIQYGDTRIYFSTQDLAFTPENGMKVVIGTVTWKAVATDPIYSGESICAWAVQLRE